MASGGRCLLSGRAGIDARASPADDVKMRRMHPLILLLAFVALLVAGVLWEILRADDCMDEGGIVVAPMTRFQSCAR